MGAFDPFGGHFALKGHCIAGSKGLDGSHQQLTALIEGAQGERPLKHLVQVRHSGRAGSDGATKYVLAGKLLVGVDIAGVGDPGQAETILAVNDLLAFGDGEGCQLVAYGKGVESKGGG